jgi:hypothetical protein
MGWHTSAEVCVHVRSRRARSRPSCLKTNGAAGAAAAVSFASLRQHVRSRRAPRASCIRAAESGLRSPHWSLTNSFQKHSNEHAEAQSAAGTPAPATSLLDGDGTDRLHVLLSGDVSGAVEFSAFGLFSVRLLISPLPSRPVVPVFRCVFRCAHATHARAVGGPHTLIMLPNPRAGRATEPVQPDARCWS